MKKDNTPEYMKQLSGKVLEINFKSQSLKMLKIVGSQKDFLKDNIAKDAKIIKA